MSEFEYPAGSEFQIYIPYDVCIYVLLFGLMQNIAIGV